MKKMKSIRALRGIAAWILLCAFFAGMLAGCAEKPAQTDTAASANPSETGETQTTTEAAASVELTEQQKEIAKIAVYTVDDLNADDSRLDEVIATNGDLDLTNRQFQMYYFMQYFGFMNQYGNYASYLGIDSTKPLSEQKAPDSGLTWEQYFVSAALDQYRQFSAVYTKAKAENYALSENETQQLDTAISGMENEAKENGFDTVDAYVQASFGPGVTMKDYEEYLRTYFLVMSYENKMYNEITWTDEDLLNYFNEHSSDYNGVTTEQKNINVRHILIQPESTGAQSETGAEGETGGTQISAEEAKAAAKAKAEALLAEYEKDPTEENFAKLAKENSSDPGSSSNGGLYEDVYPGQMVAAFNDWCFDAARKPGDTGIVETDYGYHVMYFVAQTDHYYWKTLAEKDYPMSVMDTLIREIVDAGEMTVNYESIVLGPIPQPKEDTE